MPQPTRVEVIITGPFKDKAVRVYLRRGGQVRHTLDIPARAGRGVIDGVAPGADWQVSYQWRDRFDPRRAWKKVMIAPVQSSQLYLFGDF